MLEDYKNNNHIKRVDGTVWRTAFCECGKVIYKKCLTNNTLELSVAKNSPGFYKSQTIKIHGSKSELTISCPYCEAKHIIINISEIIEVPDTTNLHT